jgi:diguanylate cyclase (GGDEF)-like protein
LFEAVAKDGKLGSMQAELLKKVGTIAALAIVYFAAGKLGLQFAVVHASASAVWPCTGIAIAAFLVLGYWVWPGILLGAFLVNLTPAGNVGTSVCIAAANTLEGMAACYLVTRFARGKDVLESAKDIFKFVALAGLLATTISATLGVMVLAAGGFASWSAFGRIWANWWLGDAVGAVVMTPVLLLWTQDWRLKWNSRQWTELTALFVGLLATSAVVVGGALQPDFKLYSLESLCIPFLIWVAFRFGQREAATAVVALGAVAAWGTLRGFGPFVGESRNLALVTLQIFMGMISLTTLTLAAEVAAHQRAEERVRHLAVSDPLTGLANYRQLVDSLETEIKRFGRTERPFVMLMMDLDDLKKINDAHGHLAGSRALCRLADMLRLYSREIDTAARYGGDEFVLILPETDAEAGRMVAQRVSKRLAEDGEEPKISVSIGMAICPDDGETVHEILAAADRDLYRDKGVPKKRFVPS